MSLLDDLATSWESFTPFQFVVPQQDRNFERPSELKNSSTSPHDLNMANDQVDNSVKIIQKFLTTKPLGISYAGKVDGIPSPELSNSLINLQSAANNKFPTENLILISNNKPNNSNIIKLIKLLQNKPAETLPEQPQLAGNSEIEKFEKLFGLPITGKISEPLIAAVKQSENFIANKLNDNTIKGMIFDPIKKIFKTSADDVAKTLDLIKKL